VRCSRGDAVCVLQRSCCSGVCARVSADWSHALPQQGHLAGTLFVHNVLRCVAVCCDVLQCVVGCVLHYVYCNMGSRYKFSKTLPCATFDLHDQLGMYIYIYVYKYVYILIYVYIRHRN